MGADLIVTFFAIKDKMNSEEGLKKTKEKMLASVERIKIKDFKYIENIIGDSPYFEAPHMIRYELEMKNEKDPRKKILQKLDDGVDKKLYIDVAKNLFKEVIEQVFNILEDGRRDVTWIAHNGEILFLTGGMSYGDNPTDSFETFEMFNNLPKNVLRAGGIK
jgi:hypothetical protein